jgi:hypothetical protein
MSSKSATCVSVEGYRRVTSSPQGIQNFKSHISLQKGAKHHQSSCLIKKVTSPHPQGANSSSKCQVDSSRHHIILKHDINLYMYNVLASKHDVIMEKGSITSPKRRTILIKGNIIQPNPKVFKRVQRPR